jgi:hypothetical protein
VAKRFASNLDQIWTHIEGRILSRNFTTDPELFTVKLCAVLSLPAYTKQRTAGRITADRVELIARTVSCVPHKGKYFMRLLSGLFRKCAGTLFLSVLLASVLPFVAVAQTNQSSDQDTLETTLTGLVTSSSAGTLVVRGENGRHQLFVFDRSSTRPRTIARGSRVTVRSVAGDEPGVRIARNVSVLSAPTPAGGNTATGRTGTTGGAQDQIITGSDDVAPPALRDLERSIQRQFRRFQAGVRAGIALDPELVSLGAHAQVATGFSRNVIFRPNIEFAFGELTTMFALNFEALYRLPVSSRQARWGAYAGAGPGLNFVKQSLTREDRDINFDDLDTDVGFNIFGGIQNRNGMFVELKTSVYADPAPTLRLMFGYNF